MNFLFYHHRSSIIDHWLSIIQSTIYDNKDFFDYRFFSALNLCSYQVIQTFWFNPQKKKKFRFHFAFINVSVCVCAQLSNETYVMSISCPDGCQNKLCRFLFNFFFHLLLLLRSKLIIIIFEYNKQYEKPKKNKNKNTWKQTNTEKFSIHFYLSVYLSLCECVCVWSPFELIWLMIDIIDLIGITIWFKQQNIYWDKIVPFTNINKMIQINCHWNVNVNSWSSFFFRIQFVVVFFFGKFCVSENSTAKKKYEYFISNRKKNQ